MEINEDTIFNIILSFMKQAENKKMSGRLKKELVMSLIKEQIGNEIYERYKPFISASIEFIINISKGLKIKLNNKKFFCFNI